MTNFFRNFPLIVENTNINPINTDAFNLGSKEKQWNSIYTNSIENNNKLLISYDGTEYCGWQNQPNMQTIQGEIESALRKIFNNQKISLIGSGRTDSGVHALGQVAHFDLKKKIKEKKILPAINQNIGNKPITIFP